MAITQFLLQSNFNSNPLLPVHSYPIKWSYAYNNNPLKKKSFLPYRSSQKPITKCIIKTHYPECVNCVVGNKGRQDTYIKELTADSDDDLNEVIWRSIKNVIYSLQGPVITSTLLVLLFLDDHRRALAASGGRVGGSAFSSFSRSSSSSTHSLSARSSSSSSSSSSSPSYSSPRSSSDSYSSYSSPSSSSYSSPSSSAQSSSSSSYRSSSYSDSPSYYYNTRISSPSSESYTTQVGSPVHPNSAESVYFSSDFFLFMTCFAMTSLAIFWVLGYGSGPSDVVEGTLKTSLLKLQVGLLGMGRSLQKDLNRLAESADTSTSQGLSFVLQEATLALLRHPDYYISAYSSVDVKKGVEECEKGFNLLSIEERCKFDEETLVNVNSIRKKSATSQTSTGLHNEYIVVTIIVAASGVHELPPIKSSTQLKHALHILASIPSSRIMAAEVLWTPQKENDTLSERQLLKDYPLLCPL